MAETADDPQPVEGERHRLYRHRRDVPPEDWRSLIEHAERDVAILEASEAWLAYDAGLPELLVDKLRAGARVRVLLADPDSDVRQTPELDEAAVRSLTQRARLAAELYRRLHHEHGLPVRLNPAPPYTSMYLADDDALVTHHVVGVPAALAPTHYVSQTGDTPGPRLSAYRLGFDMAWSDARAVGPAGSGPEGAATES